MPVLIDIEAMEQLCSRLCHDLVSPVGAINNGVELIEEMGPGMAGRAIELIAHSAEQAARRLQVFRLAYGAAGNAVGLHDAHAVAVSYFADGRVQLDWPRERLDAASVTRPGLGKLLLNLLLLADEALSHGGRISVHGDGGGVAVTAAGRAVALRPGMAEALAGAIGAKGLSPRTVGAYMTRRFAEKFDMRLTAQQREAARLDLHLSW
jgi:histidine phosphotransferase ChpT